MVTKSINTKRLDLYRRFVDDGTEYPFEYRYELFSFAAALGYIRGDRYDSDDESGYSQDFIKVSDISDPEHRAAINFIFELCTIEIFDEDEIDPDMIEIETIRNKAWTRTKEYADQGITIINNELDIQGEIDFSRLTAEAEDEWPARTANLSRLTD